MKTFIQDVIHEKGQVLLDNPSWFSKKLCSVMTSASTSDHVWSIEGWIHNKHRNRFAQPNVEKDVRVVYYESMNLFVVYHETMKRNLI